MIGCWAALATTKFTVTQAMIASSAKTEMIRSPGAVGVTGFSEVQATTKSMAAQAMTDCSEMPVRMCFPVVPVMIC